MKRRRIYRPKTAVVLAALISCGSLAATTLSDHDALGYDRQERFRKVPVVMVVLDEFPIATLMNKKGVIDDDLFPNFARIQRDSTWFRNTTTPSAFTNRAVPALLTGDLPRNFDSTTKRSSLFNLLGGSYDIRANETELGNLCPSSACDDASTPAMESLRDRYERLFPGARGEEFLRFLSYFQKVNTPRFYFMHLVMPHQPWRYLPTGQAYPQTSPIPGELDPPGKGKEWAKDKWLVTQAYQRHLLQTALLDRQIGVLIDRLKSKEIYGRSLLVVTADHGIAYAPGASKRMVTDDTIGHIGAVPLFVKKPRQRNRRISDRPLQTIDIVPTVTDVLRLSDPAENIDGISGFRNNFPKRRKRVVEWTEAGPRLRSKFDVAKMKYDMFGKSDDGLDLFKTGPGKTRGFVGRDIAEFNLTLPASSSVTLKDGFDVETTDDDAPLLPALLEGTLNGEDAHRGDKLVVVMNGRVVAVTRTYQNPNGEIIRFYSMLPPKWFGDPPNELDIYLLEDASSRTLAPLLEETSPSVFIDQ